jgi:hypothetical protein
LKIAFALLNCDNEKDSITISVHKDYPAKLSNDDFDVIIAPRVEDE